MGEVNIITRAAHLKSVAKRWAEQYPPRRYPADTDFGQIRIRLAAMKSPTVEAINSLVGNNSWTVLNCEICERDAPVLVCLSDGYERRICICRACLAAAARRAAKAAA